MEPQSLDFIQRFLATDYRKITNDRDLFYYAFNMPRLKKHRPSGVYLLGDFYVGKSIDYANRLMNHKTYITSALNEYSSSRSTASDGAIAWFERFENRLIPLFHLSDNPNDEYMYAEMLLNKGFPITNDTRQCDGYLNFNMTAKEADSIRFLENLGYSIQAPEERKYLITPENLKA